MKEQHTTKNITPPKATLEVLQRDFAHCFDKDGNFDIEKFKREISGAEVNFSNESYGMDWLGKSYARVRATDPATTLLKEDTAWNNKEENKNSENLLIKGDNLEVLKHLSHAYHEQVKMIYIDPPYNTGTDGFVYEDDRKFTPEEFAELAGVDLEQAKRILDFVDSKSNSHSAWLSFMYPRLYIARQLLRDDGVIFVSIDDNEVAQLQILMNEIFGESNFIKDLVVNTSEGGGQAKHVINGHEYLLVFCKDINKFDNLKRPKDIRGKKIEINGELYWIQEDAIRKEFGKYGNLHYEEILKHKGQEYKRKIDEGILKNDYILVPKAYGMHIVGKLRKVSEDYSKFHSILKVDTIDKNLTADGIRELEDLFLVSKGGSPFDNPKPLDLIKKVILSSTLNADGDIILDFFSGSGTTAHAAIELNALDGGNRKYILVSLPENIDKDKNQIAYDYVTNVLKIKKPTIFDITRERLVRAAQKTKAEHGDSEHISSVDFGFKIFETVPLWNGYADELVEYDANLKMFDAAKLKDDDLATLLTTWKTYDGIPLTTSLAEVDLGGYTGYYNDNKLYLVHAGFTAKHLTTLLKLIDTDTTFSPATIIIFGYHFDSARMRELAENVKSYANKKSIDIECVIRY